MKELSIVLGHDCNLHCQYCYHRIITHDSIESFDYNPDIIKYLCNSLSSGDLITYFGGEPLLYRSRIYQIDAELYDYFKLHSIDRRIITNGYYLDQDFVDFANRTNLIVGVSYDGVMTRELRGYDVLYDHYNLIRQINRLSIYATVTQINNDVYDIYRYLEQRLAGKEFNFAFSDFQLYEYNKHLVENFDFELFTDSLIRLQQYTGRNLLRCTKQKLGLSLGIDGIFRDNYQGRLAGDIYSGSNIDFSASKCLRNECEYYNSWCPYKELQVSDNDFCRRIVSCYVKANEVINGLQSK